MSFVALFPGLVYGRLEENTRKEIESNYIRKTIFERLTVGVNIKDTDIYQELAVWLLKVPEEKLKALTIDEVVEGVGEYIDMTGNLV